MAAAACAENNHTAPPPELTLAWRIEKFGVSAVMDGVIPFRLLYRMTVLSNVYHAFVSYKAGAHQLVQWSNQNPGYSAIVQNIRQLRQNGR